jgi:tyrosinase
MLGLGNSSRSKKWTLLEVERLEERALLSSSALVGSPPAGAGPLSDTPPYVRKNQSSLTKTEIDNFVNAVKALKTTFDPGSKVSVYDQFVQEHYDAFTAGHAHEGPAFFAWHREFLLEFEKKLRVVDSSVTIPYWDFTVDNSANSSIWDAKFLGGNGDPNDNWIVKTGPFASGQWSLNVNGGDGTNLRRDFGDLASTLPTSDDVQAAFNASAYDVFPFDSGSPIDQSFRNNLEGFNHPSGQPELHNRVHDWIGGSMAIAYSPNDPVFWLLHSDLDRLWAQWQAANPNDGYDPVTGAADGHNLRDNMSPFGVTPESVLDHKALGYVYDTEDGGGGGGGPLVRTAPRSRLSFLASLHGLHTGGADSTALLATLTAGSALPGEHLNHLLLAMVSMNLRDLAGLAGSAAEATGTGHAGTASMGLPHVCY